MIEVVGQNNDKMIVRTDGVRSKQVKEVTPQMFYELLKSYEFKDIRQEVNAKLEEFKKSAELSVMKLFMLNGANNYMYDELVNGLTYTAQQLGLIVNSTQLKVDDTHKGIYFTNLGKIVTFDLEKMKTNSNVVTDMTDISVLDKNVVQLSKFGLDALEHMYLEIGSNKVTVADLLLFIERIENISFEQVYYIGITPSNKLFKLIVGTVYAVECYSVAFGDEDTFMTKKRANKLLSGNSENAYVNYVNSVGPGMPFYCTKFSYKDYSRQLYGSAEQMSRSLKNKYKTLRDVYFGDSRC